MAADLPPLQRTSTGLSASHIELIKLLAAVAVEDYLHKSDEAVQTNGELHEVMT